MISGRFPATDIDCPRCGARDWEAWRPGVFAAVREWLQYGAPWRPVQAVCRRCGTEVSGGSVAVVVPRPRRWWDGPARFIQVLRWGRTAQPVPRLYLTVAVIGVTLGMAARALWGWPWWAVPASLLVATWLIFLSTAFVGPMADRGRLREDLIDALLPSRALARRRRAEELLMRHPPFPLFGVTGWSGTRSMQGYTRTPAGVASLALGHGSVHGERGVIVSVSRLDSGTLRWNLDRDEDAGEAVEAVTIDVDGRPVSFQRVVSEDSWRAFGAVSEDVAITLDAFGVDVRDIRLERVRDVEPYIEGSRREDALDRPEGRW